MMTEQDTDLWLQQNVIRNHLNSVFLKHYHSIWFSPRAMASPVLGSQPEQGQTWVPAHGLGRVRATITPEYHMAGQQYRSMVL